MNHQLQLIVPSHSIRWFEEGEHCSDAVDGDVIVVRHKTIAADLIAEGQKALVLTEPNLKGFTWCDHTAFIRGKQGTRTMVSEMGPRGYERRPLFDYVAELYAVVHFEVAAEQVKNACANDVACQGVAYGWAEYLPLILDGITDAKFAGSWGDHIICSTHVALLLQAMGLFPDRPTNEIAPCHLALWFGASHA